MILIKDLTNPIQTQVILVMAVKVLVDPTRMMNLDKMTMQVRTRKTAAPMQVGQAPVQAVLQKEKTIPVAQVALVVR